MKFSWIIFIIFSLGILIVGHSSKLYLKNHRNQGEESFLLGGRSIGEFIGAGTLIATSYSGWGFIGSPGSAYEFGTIEVLANFMFAPAVAIGTLLFANYMRKRALETGGLTIPDYLAKTHEGTETERQIVHFIAGLTTFIFLSIYMIGQVRALGLVGAEWLGVSEVFISILLMAIIAIFTMEGGLLAVAVTDTLMCLGMLIATFIVTGVMLKNSSFKDILEGLSQMNPSLVNPPTAHPYGQNKFNVFYVFIYAMLFTTTLPYMSVRFLSLKEDIKVHKMALYIAPMGIILSFIPWVGLYMKMQNPELVNPDRVMPLFLNNYLPAGVGAIITLFILFAMISTISSVLQTQAAALSFDVLRLLKSTPFKHPEKINKWAVFFVSFLTLGLTFYAPQGMLNQIAYLGTGGIIAMFSGPILMNKILHGNLKTCLISMIFGFVSYLVFNLKFSLGWVEPPIYASLIGMVSYFCADRIQMTLTDPMETSQYE